MKYRISCLHQESGMCEQIIEEPNDGAAMWHYEGLLVRQPSDKDHVNYTDWKLEKIPVEGKIIAQG